MTKPVDLQEVDYSKPVDKKKIQEVGVFRVGGLYEVMAVNRNLYFLVTSIEEITYLKWRHGNEPKEVQEYCIHYLLDEKLCRWKTNLENILHFGNQVARNQ